MSQADTEVHHHEVEMHTDIDKETHDDIIQTTADEPEFPKEVNGIDSLFGDKGHMFRVSHTYDDGIITEILNLNDNVPLNGSRVFYSVDDKGTKNVICKFPGYSIEKHVVSDKDPTAGLQEILGPVSTGALCLTNDGPLLLVFKIASRVRLHMMRSANHGYDEQFKADFTDQYEGARFEDLFSANTNDSSYCHLFRQGIRTSAMEPPMDPDGRTLLYLGYVKCEIYTVADEGQEVPLLRPSATALNVETAVSILKNKDLGLICYRYDGGEIQVLAETYLRRVAVTTGHSMDQLISGDTENSEESSPFEERSSVKLTNSRFPRVLDFLALYILCGVNPNRKMATVSGFSTVLDVGGRILARPKCGFYNFCRTAEVNPRRAIPFPATPSAMRLAVRRIILDYTLSSKLEEMEKQFDDYENVFCQLVPQLVCRTLRGSAILISAFEGAFGVSASSLLRNLPAPSGVPELRSVRSALLLANHYELVTISRFAMRHLLGAEFTPSAMREAQLISMLSEYSNSSRHRRHVAESLNVNAESTRNFVPGT